MLFFYDRPYFNHHCHIENPFSHRTAVIHISPISQALLTGRKKSDDSILSQWDYLVIDKNLDLIMIGCFSKALFVWSERDEELATVCVFLLGA